MKKYGVLLQCGDREQVLKTCHARETAEIAVRLQQSIHRQDGCRVRWVLAEFDERDQLIGEECRLCA